MGYAHKNENAYATAERLINELSGRYSDILQENLELLKENRALSKKVQTQSRAIMILACAFGGFFLGVLLRIFFG